MSVQDNYIRMVMSIYIHTSGTRAQDHTHMSGKPFWEAESGGLGSNEEEQEDEFNSK